MRILSKFKDYYDYVQKYGQDFELVYDRKSEDILTRGKISFSVSSPLLYDSKLSRNLISRCCLFFCGELFPYYSITKFINDKYRYKTYYVKPGYIIEHKDTFKLEDCKVSLSNTILEAIPSNVPVAFIEYKSSRVSIKTNPLLSDLEFYKEYSPEITFQKIAQYLYQNKESKAKYDGEVMDDYVSDKDLIEAKGFDKFSFRKQKKQS